MLEHPSQIIRFGESVIPTVMVYTGKFLITDISSCFLQCFISVTGELYIDYAIGAAMINTESRLALKVCQTLQICSTTDRGGSGKQVRVTHHDIERAHTSH